MNKYPSLADKLRLPILAFSVLMVCSFVFAGCVQTTVSGKPIPGKKKGFTLPSESPNTVVEKFLKSLKAKKFREAYNYISTDYAGNLDKEGYDLNMRKGMVENLKWSLSGYDIMGVRILGRRAYVVSKVDINYKPIQSQEMVSKLVRIQYELSIIERRWVIVADKCIYNCEQNALESSGNIDLKPIEFE